MYYLFLDDERNPSDVNWIKIPNVRWSVCRNFHEFKKYIDVWGMPEAISFDHDLAPEHYEACINETHDYGNIATGYDCAKWLVEYCRQSRKKIPQYTVHSLNPVGRENITTYLENAKKHLKL
jgi:hypothetical protein